MARFKPIEHVPHQFFKPRLVEVEQAQLFRNLFPYDEVPRIDFDFHVVPISPAREPIITDTTFRDGQQARPPYSADQIVTLFDFLHRISGPQGVIRQSEFFLYSQRDREAVRRCQELGHAYPEITGWIRARAEDLDLVKEMGLTETGILVSVSDYHIFLKMGLDRKKAFDQYLDIARRTLEAGITPRCHFEDVTRADIPGFALPLAAAMMDLAAEAGRDIKIRLCDTLGLGVTYAGAALPRSVPRMVRAFIEQAGVPERCLEWHGHNDFHKVLVCATTAWLYGCAAANGTLFGFGERTGNPPIEGLIMEYIALTGEDRGIDTRAITEAADYYQAEMDTRLPAGMPFVGRDFNATAAGIHVDGLLKNPEIYNIFDTDKLLGRPPAVIINDKSGAAGVAHWINTRLIRDPARYIDKRHPGVNKVVKKLGQQYDEGRTTSMSHREIEHLVRKYLPELFVSEFDRLKAKALDLAEHLIQPLLEAEALATMAPAIIEPVLEDFLEANPFVQFLYVTNAQGYKITKNICHVTDRVKYEAALLDEDFSGRDWFIGPIKDGQTHVTDFYSSRITGALCITVSGPIRGADEEIIGVLGVDIRFEDMARLDEVVSSPEDQD
jgi:isopropylmalate/homocitrate/citramalate synthase